MRLAILVWVSATPVVSAAEEFEAPPDQAPEALLPPSMAAGEILCA